MFLMHKLDYIAPSTSSYSYFVAIMRPRKPFVTAPLRCVVLSIETGCFVLSFRLPEAIFIVISTQSEVHVVSADVVMGIEFFIGVCRYDMARAGVAVSDSPTGPFRYLRSFRPHGEQCRDLTLFKVCFSSRLF